MLFEQPVYRMLGDSYLSIEFADTVHLRENFRIQAIAKALAAEPAKGIVEIVPHLRNLAIVFDRAQTTPDKMRDFAQEAVEQVETPLKIESRLFRIPIWYDDPWSQALANKYDVVNNLEFVAVANSVSVDTAIQRHSGTDFWIAAVGFVPGCYWAIPLDFGLTLSAPKYRIPRDFTPARTLALAGLSTTIYPYAGPGGYQCIGRSAIDIYSPGSANPLFPEDGILVRAGDRHRHYSVGPLEYEDIRNRSMAGSYEYEVTVETVALGKYDIVRRD